MITTLAVFACLVANAYGAGAPSPDDDFTPGDTREAADCHGPRPSLSAEDRAASAAHYHITARQHVAEWDHRIPHGCCGATNVKNVWPQSSPAKIDKDRLEHWMERQVHLGTITVEQCQEAFKAPNHWQDRYRVIFKAEPRQ